MQGVLLRVRPWGCSGFRVGAPAKKIPLQLYGPGGERRLQGRRVGSLWKTLHSDPKRAVASDLPCARFAAIAGIPPAAAFGKFNLHVWLVGQQSSVAASMVPSADLRLHEERSLISSTIAIEPEIMQNVGQTLRFRPKL